MNKIEKRYVVIEREKEDEPGFRNSYDHILYQSDSLSEAIEEFNKHNPKEYGYTIYTYYLCDLKDFIGINLSDVNWRFEKRIIIKNKLQ